MPFYYSEDDFGRGACFNVLQVRRGGVFMDAVLSICRLEGVVGVSVDAILSII